MNEQKSARRNIRIPPKKSWLFFFRVCAKSGPSHPYTELLLLRMQMWSTHSRCRRNGNNNWVCRVALCPLSRRWVKRSASPLPTTRFRIQRTAGVSCWHSVLSNARGFGSNTASQTANLGWNKESSDAVKDGRDIRSTRLVGGIWGNGGGAYRVDIWQVCVYVCV